MKEDKENAKTESDTKKNSTKKVLVATTLAGVIGLGVGFGVGFCVPKTTTTDKYTIEVASQQGVSISCDKDKGNEYTLVAKDVEGYNFVCWEHNGELITDKTYTFVVDETTEGTYTAIYQIQKCTVTVYVDGEEVAHEEKDWGTAISTILLSDITSEITSDNSCGWFLDEELTQKVNVEDLVKGNVNLYTKTATTDKLTFTDPTAVEALETDPTKTWYVSAANTSIEGEVVIPETYNGGKVVGIDESGFANTAISSITLPSSITEIPASAFSGCTKLESIQIPETITLIGKSAFLGSGIRNVSWAGTSKVKAIAESTFEDCTNLSSITLPASVTEIGKSAFKGSAVSSVNFENMHTLTTIGEEAFKNTTDLKNFTLSNTVTTLGKEAFYYSTLENFVFEDNSALTELADGLFQYSRLSKIAYGANCKIESIGVSCFAGTSLEGAYIPKSVKTIYNQAFQASYITTLEFEKGSNLETVYVEAFADCVALKEIDFSKDFVVYTESGEESPVSESGVYVFTNLISLKTIKVQTNMSILAKDLFDKECLRLERIVVEDGVTEFSFGGNYYRENEMKLLVSLPESIEKVDVLPEAYLFVEYRGQMTAAKYLKVFSEMTIYGKDYYEDFYDVLFNFSTEDLVDETTKVVELPEGMTTISSLLKLSELYPNMEKLVVPASVTMIDEYGLTNCANLKEVVFAENSKLETVEMYAFAGCEKLEKVVLPESVTTLEMGAFQGCESLKSVTIPDGMTTIAVQLFEDCINLKEVVLPESVTTIGIGAFTNCEKLDTITLPESVTTIGSRAFVNCLGLTTITIPASVTMIGDYAFYGCAKLVEVYNLSGLTITAGNVNNGYVAYYALDVYTSLESESKLVKYGDYLMYEDKDNQTYYLISYLGDEAELTLPTMEHDYIIYDYAFYNCSNLTTVVFTEGLTGIGQYAFANCDALSSVTFASPWWDIYQDSALPTIEVSQDDTAANAELLRKYSNYEWKRSAR